MSPASSQIDGADSHATRRDLSPNPQPTDNMHSQPFDKLDVGNHVSGQEREPYPLHRLKSGETEIGKRITLTGDGKNEFINTRSDLTTQGTIITRTRLEGFNAPSQNTSTIQKLENIIQDQVKILNVSSSKTLSVAVKPDTGLSMTLTLQQVDQQILVSARMDEPTANLLKPQWAELQKELESQGIRLNHQVSDQPFQPKQQHTRDGSMTPNFSEDSDSQSQTQREHSQKPIKSTKPKISDPSAHLKSSLAEHHYYA